MFTHMWPFIFITVSSLAQGPLGLSHSYMIWMVSTTPTTAHTNELKHGDNHPQITTSNPPHHTHAQWQAPTIKPPSQQQQARTNAHKQTMTHHQQLWQ
ncbi:hypothetical protein K443DRAFT_8331 [Laccaria amethystina LaAM-08-1]|uniref:Uncharacterized protein n=1 Tax=Laccaria amethystina LaAM-08-1 TaxID=1095629 RepID=A0A0C9XPK8_9AGAR|nr:hypothetical protein K443DRAFT_8331 [Laccaria amethystina LaAM-08-1]